MVIETVTMIEAHESWFRTAYGPFLKRKREIVAGLGITIAMVINA
jgi:hypothetical protein